MPTLSGGEQTPQKVIRLRVKDYVNAVAWNTDGSRLAALGNFGGTVTIWDSSNWAFVREFHRYGGAYSQNSFAYLPDGTLLTASPIGRSPDPRYATLEIFSLIQWNPETGEPVRYIPDASSRANELPSKIGPTNTFAVSPDGAVVAGVRGKDILLYDTHTWSLQTRFAIPPTPKHPDFAHAIAISPDGRQAAVGTHSGYVHFFGLADASIRLSVPVYTLDSGFGCSAVVFSPDGEFLATGKGGLSLGERDDGWTRIWRVSDGSLVAHLLGGGGSVRTAAWSPDGSTLAIGDDSSLSLWLTDQLPREPTIRARIPHGSYSAAFAPQGMLAASNANEVAIFT